MHFKAHVFRFLLGLFTVAIPAEAAEVTLPYKGLTLNGNLELATGKKPTDGVILITHGGLAHRQMEMIVYLQKQLTERGYHTLAINLSLGLNNRRGGYDCKVTHRHRNSDAPAEIAAWVEWLRARGTRWVAVLGHSRGGAQTALYAAEHPSDELVKAVVLLAPPTRANNDAETYQRRYGVPLASVLAKAHKLIKNGKGGTPMAQTHLMQCPDTTVTADSFVSYYDPQAPVDTLELIPKINRPTLVVVAENDDVVLNLGEKLNPLVDGKRVQMKVIDGADHLFRDLFADDAVDLISAFLKDAGY